jgi:PEGA domain-containing protein
MDPALAPGSSPRPIVFQDGLGERRRVSDVSGADAIEMLCLRDELTAIPSFEFALRERASRLASFRHTSYGRVRSVDRLNDATSTLAVVSDSTKGVRLANLLAANEKRPGTLDISAALHLTRQLAAAVAMLHENARDVSHGAIGPERVIVTPNARIVVVEYVLGAALEQLHFSHERYWKELRIALPSSPGLPRFDHRADVTQVGIVALSLVLGRPLREDEYPARIGDALASASAMSSTGEREPLPAALRTWLTRALQLDPRHSFTSSIDMRDELDRVLANDEEDETVAVSIAEPTPAAEAPGSPAARLDVPTVQAPPAASAVTVTLPPAPIVVPVPVPAPAPSRAFEARAEKSEPWKTEERFAFEPARVEAPKAEAPKFEVPRVEPSIVRPAAASPSAHSFETTWRHPIDRPEDDRHSEGSVVKQPRHWGRLAAAAVVLLALAAAGVPAVRRYLLPGTSVPPTGTLNITSNPPGARVLVDGVMNGVTPLTVSLRAGSHTVELQGGGEPRTVPVTIAAGAQLSQYIELPKTVTAFGQLQIRTEPAGAQVTVDGIPRGKSPVLVEALAAGDHAVVLESDGATVKQSVSVDAGQTASLVVPLAAAESGPLSGWIAIAAPVELQLYENGRLIGTSQSERMMVSAGRHEIEMVNENVGYRAVKTVQVPPGKVAAIRTEWPKGSIAINALPWAEVWIDGERIGETPLGNISLPIGPHEIVFRHPELGEQKYAATVSLKAPVRVSVDLRKK